MAIDIFTLIMFNFERASALMYPFDKEWRVDLCRRLKNIFIVPTIIGALINFFTGNIVDEGCGILFGYQSVIYSTILNIIVSFLWYMEGNLFWIPPIFIEPILCIILTVQIRKIIKASKELRKNNKANSSNYIKEIKLSIGQLIIAIYILFCLFPSGFFLTIGIGNIFTVFI